MISVSTVLRRTFRIYAKQHALAPLAAGLIGAFVALSHVPGRRSLAVEIGVLVIAAVAIGLFVCVVVRLVADVFDNGTRRSSRELLSAAWSALARLLLVGVVGTIAIAFVSSIAPAIVLGVLATAAINEHGGGGFLLTLVALILLVPLLSMLLLLLQLRLCTSWSVSAAVVVLERPGGLRALGRSRDLVRGNRWRVLALILALALPFALAARVVDVASGSASSAPGLIARILIGALIAPIPMLASTVLYFELRAATPTVVPVDPTPPSALPPGLSLP
jgi:hypothetical protein